MADQGNIFSTTSVYPSAVTSRNRRYQAMSETLSGRIQVRSLGVQRREFTIKYSPMNRTDFDAVWRFINDNLEGSLYTFEIYVPDHASGAAATAFNFATGDGLVSVTVRLKNDVQEYAIDNDSLYEYEIDCVEVLS